MLISYSLWPVPRPGFEARHLSNAGKVFEVFCSVVTQMWTNSVEQIASWADGSCLADQEIPGRFWNPSAHCRVYERLPALLVLSKVNPIYTITLYSLRCFYHHPIYVSFINGILPSSFRIFHFPHSSTNSSISEQIWSVWYYLRKSTDYEEPRGQLWHWFALSYVIAVVWELTLAPNMYWRGKIVFRHTFASICKERIL
jgi:hypothetical protein